jgi:ribose-phosphate pyrophosphokinase
MVAHVRSISAERPVALVSPDLGGAKRVQLLAETFPEAERSSLRLGFCEKRRSEGVVSGDLFAGNVADRDVWIVDDMIVGGGTMLRALATVRAAGAASVRLAATHALFGPAELDRMLEAGAAGVTVSDTTAPIASDLRAREGLDVLPVASLLAGAVRALTGDGLES